MHLCKIPVYKSLPETDKIISLPLDRGLILILLFRGGIEKHPGPRPTKYSVDYNCVACTNGNCGTPAYVQVRRNQYSVRNHTDFWTRKLEMIQNYLALRYRDQESEE